MNCREFENAIRELASRQVTDKARQIEAFEHAGRCLWCAMRLDEETRLTESLQAFAGILRGRCAPNRVEEALLQAHRERNPEPVRFRFRFPGEARWRGLGWGAAFAAALAIASFVVFHWPHAHPGPIAPAAQSVNKPHQGSPAPALAKLPAPPHIGTTREAAPVPGPAPSLRPSSTPERAQARPAGAAGQTEGSQQEQPFISLGTCDDSQCMDEVTLVRVTLPADAPLAFGVGSGTEDFSGGPVEADVALGSDGVPFAIRFVN